MHFIDQIDNTNFNPHHPRGWRPFFSPPRIAISIDFNPHHPRGWRLGTGLQRRLPRHISIHTTLAGGDVCWTARGIVNVLTFQSTPPSRVATIKFSFSLAEFVISIHTTLAGGDLGVQCLLYTSTRNFNPHHPRGWRPLCIAAVFRSRAISIHTTLAGGD